MTSVFSFHSISVMVREHHTEVMFSFYHHHVGPKRVFRVSDKHLYQLTHLSGPLFSILIRMVWKKNVDSINIERMVIILSSYNDSVYVCLFVKKNSKVASKILLLWIGLKTYMKM